MALQGAVTQQEGSPRIGPALSATTHLQAALDASQRVGINLYPWQEHALDVSMACNKDGDWLYREVAIVVARQNGKSSLLKPRIVAGLSAGERILHTAQNRIIPRTIFLQIGASAAGNYKVREANGQEIIIDLDSGGTYTIIAPQRGVRGHSADLLIIDEVREFEDFEFIGAAEPTLTASANPQIIYLSNAGQDTSIVLNDLKARSGSDPNLAYMEWSAEPHLEVDDHAGWLQANPSIGYSNLSLDRLQSLYDKYRLSNELAVFETEHLCRWVLSMFPRLVQDADWQRARRETEPMQRSSMGINVDPSGTRVSVAFAWPQTDGSLGLMARDFTGSPVNLQDLAVDLIELTKANPPNVVGFDPWTDQHLARHFPNAKQVNGSEFANACERFVRAVETGAIRWEHAEAVSNDLPYTARKPTTGTAFIAARAKEERSISAVLAAIRAVWIASAPQQPSVIF